MKRLEMWFDKLRIKFLCWRAGEGFKMPKAKPKEHCLYNYCKSIVNDEVMHKINFYEDELQELIDRCECEATRKDVAKIYMEALEWVYGKGEYLMEKYYKISEELLIKLMRDRLVLAALEIGGVDNWSWYCESRCDFLDEAGAEDFDELAEREVKELELEEIE